MRRATPPGIKILMLILTYFCLNMRHAQADVPARVAKPMSVLFKTTAYGTAAGAVFGVGGAALFGGGLKTFGKVTSMGMYSGILVGLYILLAPPDLIYGAPEKGAGPEDDDGERPRSKRRWHDDQDRNETDEQSRSVPGPAFRGTPALVPSPTLWIPVVKATF